MIRFSFLWGVVADWGSTFTHTRAPVPAYALGVSTHSISSVSSPRLPWTNLLWFAFRKQFVYLQTLSAVSTPLRVHDTITVIWGCQANPSALQEKQLKRSETCSEKTLPHSAEHSTLVLKAEKALFCLVGANIQRIFLMTNQMHILAHPTLRSPDRDGDLSQIHGLKKHLSWMQTGQRLKFWELRFLKDQPEKPSHSNFMVLTLWSHTQS